MQGFKTKHLGPWEITFPYFPYQWPKGQMDIWWLLVYWSTCWPPGSLRTWYTFQSPCGYHDSFCSSHHILTLSFYNLEVSFLWSYSSSSMAILTVGALLPPPFLFLCYSPTLSSHNPHPLCQPCSGYYLLSLLWTLPDVPGCSLSYICNKSLLPTLEQ